MCESMLGRWGSVGLLTSSVSCAEAASTVRVRVRGVDSRTCPFAGAISCCGSGPVSFPAPGWSRASASIDECGGWSAETWVVVGVDPKFTRLGLRTSVAVGAADCVFSWSLGMAWYWSGCFGCCSIQAGMSLLRCEREESASSLSARFSSFRSSRRMSSDFRCASTWAAMSSSCRREDSSSSRRWRRLRMDAAELVVVRLAREPVSQLVGS